MLREWTELGVGRHFTEEAVLCTASSSDYENLKVEFQKLNALTERHGTRYALAERQKDGSCILRITVLANLLKRNAGPRRKRGCLRSIGELCRYQELHSTKECAEYAGVALRSYQRRVKKYREEGKWSPENPGYF